MYCEALAGSLGVALKINPHPPESLGQEQEGGLGSAKKQLHPQPQDLRNIDDHDSSRVTVGSSLYSKMRRASAWIFRSQELTSKVALVGIGCRAVTEDEHPDLRA